MTTIRFTSSTGFIEQDPAAAEAEAIEVTGYIEGTYNTLRTGPHGNEIASLVDGAWELADGRRFSDWAVAVAS